MKELTRDHLKAIIEAIGAQLQGDALCLADWGRVLEHAAAEGFDVSGNIARINAQLPEWITPLELATIESPKPT